MVLTEILMISAASPAGTATLSFDINDGQYLPAALIVYTQQAINVSYTGIGQLSSGALSASRRMTILSFSIPLIIVHLLLI
jgi:hypothetical protein